MINFGAASKYFRIGSRANPAMNPSTELDCVSRVEPSGWLSTLAKWFEGTRRTNQFDNNNYDNRPKKPFERGNQESDCDMCCTQIQGAKIISDQKRIIKPNFNNLILNHNHNHNKRSTIFESRFSPLLLVLAVSFVLSSTGLQSNHSLVNSLVININEQQANSNNGTTKNQPPTSSKLLDVDALSYLQRYGYMNETMANANLISEDAFSEAVMNFQRFAGISETGTVDEQTVKFMQMPRCGNKDMSGKGENGKRRRRRKRYALQGSKWKRHELTYRISQYPTKFLHKKHEVDKQIEKAFRIWSQVAPIDFVAKQDGRVHVDIRFASGEHGDGDPFDGPGNTLAHAYFPQYGGDAHFDDQEYWTVDSYTGTNIFQVAAHELGHSLGLGHSSVKEALMAPFYQKYKPNFKLHADDILAIQALYGERGEDSSSSSTTSTTSTSTSTTTTTTESPVEREPVRPSSGRKPPNRANDDGGSADEAPAGSGWFNFGSSKPVDLCQESSIDAITRTEDGSTYVFRGQYYWQLKNEGLMSGYPAKISRDWDGLPANLDAALTWSDGKTFFFKGDKYWRFFNKRREPGYPKQISVGFSGIPNNIDAAFVWGGNGKTYFFKRDKYWRFDSKQEPPVSSQYPKSIRNWGGLPSTGIDSAFKWENGMTYFFKDGQYYRFDDREFEVDSSARPSFPRSTAEWWFGCTNSNLPLRNQPNDTVQGLVSNLHKQLQSKPIESNSISNNIFTYRSIIDAISTLLPSSSSQTDKSAQSSNLQDDWSFHRGVGEEISRAAKVARSAGSNHRFLSVGTNRAGHKFPVADDTRWHFPVSAGHRSSREESLSEIKMEPGDKQVETST